MPIKDKIEQGLCTTCFVSEAWMKKVIQMKWEILARRSYLLRTILLLIFVMKWYLRIHEINGTGKMIYTTGCSLGATHAANMMLRRPDLFMGCIGLSGYYDTDLILWTICR